ncbi:oligoendopeptidase F [Acholeplasma hippikon]|nr:oligoendopeptidase F [Acholeplasma hippikon]
MKKQLPKRSEVDVKYTWDVYTIFKNEESFNQALIDLKQQVLIFKEKHQGKLKNPETINQAIDELKDIQGKLVRINAFSSLQASGESTDEVNQMRVGRTGLAFQEISKNLTFVSIELKENSVETLNDAIKLSEDNKLYIEDVIDEKNHALHPEVEKAIQSLSGVINAPYGTYNRFKLADMKFNDFEVNGVNYPNSFTLFENEYEYDNHTEVRRKAYECFYSKLGEYQNGFASNYYAHLLKEKAMSELRGYSSVVDYLLHDQKVTKDLMDRQIDVIMRDLSPVMRKYARVLKEIHGLDKMTYADLKIAIDPEFEPKVSIESSKDMLLEGLSILGDEYLEIVRRSFDERWIDFPQNVGKSTGGFCSSPYGANSFILINWNGQMDEVMVLAHELGHAGHFQYANKHQSIFNTRPSLYFIEAPSTTNELIMSRTLDKNAKDLRTKRWIKSVMISRTYYHNMVTHLLEAAFQREVYKKIDAKEPISANVLNNIKLNVIKNFWGDEVEIPVYAGLTWMRQPHYFMGLYPYTYSAGLTIGTEVSRKIFEGELDPTRWIDVLKAGGTKRPFDLARMVDVDLSTEAPLVNTIKFIDEAVEEIIAITKSLKQQ